MAFAWHYTTATLSAFIVRVIGLHAQFVCTREEQKTVIIPTVTHDIKPITCTHDWRLFFFWLSIPSEMEFNYPDRLRCHSRQFVYVCVFVCAAVCLYATLAICVICRLTEWLNERVRWAAQSVLLCTLRPHSDTDTQALNSRT